MLTHNIFMHIPQLIKNIIGHESWKILINHRAGDPAALARGGMPAPIFF